jgi:hypothetical protein
MLEQRLLSYLQELYGYLPSQLAVVQVHFPAVAAVAAWLGVGLLHHLLALLVLAVPQ